jgi:hypothetical protein
MRNRVYKEDYISLEENFEPTAVVKVSLYLVILSSTLYLSPVSYLYLIYLSSSSFLKFLSLMSVKTRHKEKDDSYYNEHRSSF